MKNLEGLRWSGMGLVSVGIEWVIIKTKFSLGLSGRKNESSQKLDERITREFLETVIYPWRGDGLTLPKLELFFSTKVGYPEG